MKFTNLGPNMWKTESEREPGTFHYQSSHLCPFLDYAEFEDDDEALEIHWICSCDAFSKSIPGPQNKNPLEDPCKHIDGLLEMLPDKEEEGVA